MGRAQTQELPGVMPLSEFAEKRGNQLEDAKRAKINRCRSTRWLVFRVAGRDVAPEKRASNLDAWQARKIRARAQRGCYRLMPVPAIRWVFGSYAEQAIAVARCETGGSLWPGSSNGQYLGMFQMGSYARAAYGHSSTAYGQALAAHRYFVASGRDWSPWQCRPWGLAW